MFSIVISSAFDYTVAARILGISDVEKVRRQEIEVIFVLFSSLWMSTCTLLYGVILKSWGLIFVFLMVFITHLCIMSIWRLVNFLQSSAPLQPFRSIQTFNCLITVLVAFMDFIAIITLATYSYRLFVYPPNDEDTEGA